MASSTPAILTSQATYAAALLAIKLYFAYHCNQIGNALSTGNAIIPLSNPGTPPTETDMLLNPHTQLATKVLKYSHSPAPGNTDIYDQPLTSDGARAFRDDCAAYVGEAGG